MPRKDEEAGIAGASGIRDLMVTVSGHDSSRSLPHRSTLQRQAARRLECAVCLAHKQPFPAPKPILPHQARNLYSNHIIIYTYMYMCIYIYIYSHLDSKVQLQFRPAAGSEDAIVSALIGFWSRFKTWRHRETYSSMALRSISGWKIFVGKSFK